MVETLAVFGATGQTGRHVVTYALEKGYKVQAMARTPSKVETKHANLTIEEGDFSNEEAIQKTVAGATYVISCAGGDIKQKPYNKIMTPFVKLLWPILEKEESVKVFLYQSGALALAAGEQESFMMRNLMKPMIYMMTPLKEMVADNQEVMDFLQGKTSSHVKTIVSRPGGLKEAKASTELVASETSYMGMVTFADLAAFTVEAIKDESLYGKSPFPVPKK